MENISQKINKDYRRLIKITEDGNVSQVIES